MIFTLIFCLWITVNNVLFVVPIAHKYDVRPLVQQSKNSRKSSLLKSVISKLKELTSTQWHLNIVLKTDEMWRRNTLDTYSFSLEIQYFSAFNLSCCSRNINVKHAVLSRDVSNGLKYNDSQCKDSIYYKWLQSVSKRIDTLGHANNVRSFHKRLTVQICAYA